MAVEKSKVIERLKALFPKANLSQKRLDALADKLAKKPADDADDAAIDAVINDLNEVIDITELARDDDRMRTLEAKTKQPAPPAPPTDPKPEDPKPTDDVPDWAKKIAADLEEIKTGKIIESKKATAADLFAKSEILKNIPEKARVNWINRIDVNSETSFEDQVKGLEEEYTELVQHTADENDYSGPAGGGSPKNKEAKADVVDSILERVNV